MRSFMPGQVEAVVLAHQNYTKREPPRVNEAEAFMRSVLELNDTPMPPRDLLRFFWHDEVIDQLRKEVSFEIPGLQERLVGSDPIRETLPRVSYRIRELSPRGTYPMNEWNRRGQAYVVRQGRPFLITKNFSKTEDSLGFSEISHIARHEVKLAASYLIAESAPAVCFYFDGITHDISSAVVERVPDSLRGDFLVEYATLLSQMYGQRFVRSGGDSLNADYSFTAQPDTIDEVIDVFDHFSIRDFLLLRVATHLVKATMLWRTGPFLEEAVANVYFALEGSLLLVQRKHGLAFEKINRSQLPQILDRMCRNGSALFEFIDEAIGWGGRRASIVHSHVKRDYGWVPFLMADDYYEYVEIVRMLLYYVLTGRVFDEFSTARRS